jgi:hypothetical protein
MEPKILILRRACKTLQQLAGFYYYAKDRNEREKL